MEFVDINHNIIGNSTLESEKSHAFQSSLDIYPLKNDKKFISINIEGFINYLDNKIELAQIEESNSYTYYNIEKETYYGLNSNLNTTIKRHTFTFIWNIYNIENELFTNTMPRQNMSFLYSFEHEKWNLRTNISWKYKSKSEYQRIDENEQLNTYQQEPYQLINFNFFKNIPDIHSSISLGIKNILDVKTINSTIEDGFHADSENIISWGRTFFIEFRLNLLNK
jgi:outer membrane receptor for ferrienterochelin and colicins